VGERDFEDARRSTELLAAEMSRLGVGEVVSLWDRGERRPPVVTGGWHHMGTTRMSADPGSGVVDADCRVHGVDNLYVAGSSVFPTSGYANPTLTLVALAVRLGRHLTI
jgi:choline dehydrogenase-like flavoprotein